MRLSNTRRGVALCLALALTAAIAGTTHAQILLLDNFDDTHGPLAAQNDGIVDVSTYRAPFGGGGDFVGRTQFRFGLPSENVDTAAPGSTDGKVAVLELSTFDSVAAVPGTSFLGTDLITKRNFARGGGLRMTTRMRLDAATAAQGGMVASAFMYDVTRGTAPNLVRDEIDHELLTNYSSGAAPRQTLTNVWNDGNFESAGAPQNITNPVGFNAAAFHDYRTDWTPSSVKYFIDDVLVRTESSVVPDDPMKAHWNFWAPDATFAAAYNAGLTASATSPGTTYKVEVDKVQVERFNTAVSSNLLVDPSFENQTRVDGGIGGWQLFNNASYDGIQVEPQEGGAGLKVYGPFTGGPNASGAFQGVAALPGQEFEGSVYCQAPSFDPIKSQQNYTALTMQFCNAANAVIGSVNFGPGTNQTETPIYDGRDANMIQDQWVQYSVNGIAPAGTAYVRLNLFFIQLANQGGAAWFDNASLVRLTNTAPAENADFNGDAFVDGDDFLLWQRNLGLNTGAALGQGDANGDGAVNGADLAIWRTKFGQGSAMAAAGTVPEPGSIVIVAAAFGAILATRRRRLT